MTMKQFIEMGLAYAGLSQTDLAGRLGMSRQLLSKRIKTGKFSFEELEQIAHAIGAEFIPRFVFQDGKEV